jgi:hypothetical protein
MFCFSPKFNTGTTAGFRLANLGWYGLANLQEWERNRAELLRPSAAPSSEDLFVRQVEVSLLPGESCGRL